MTEPSTHHHHEVSPINEHAMDSQQQHLVADELPMSEDDHALAMQTSKSLLQQINNRTYMSQRRRQDARQRPRRSTRTTTSPSVEKLAQGLDRQNLHQSPLRSCVNSRCTPAIAPNKPSSNRAWELDHGRRTETTKAQKGPEVGTEKMPSAPSLKLYPESSKPETSASTEPTSTPAEDSSAHQNGTGSAHDSASTPLLIADSDEDVDEDEGFFDGPDDLMGLGEDSNGMMSALGAFRRRGLLRFRRSTEAASTCPIIVRNVPRMRRRKQKMEVRLRAATMPEEPVPGRPGNATIV